jgi:fatty acid synthase subunit alpha, fungi type
MPIQLTILLEKVKVDTVKSYDEKAQVQQKAEGYIKLERGFATIPLLEIDVPFHSRYL